MCANCGGLIMEEGQAYAYCGPVCKCLSGHRPHRPVLSPMLPAQGWQCPVCRNVHGPHVATCPSKHA